MLSLTSKAIEQAGAVIRIYSRVFRSEKAAQEHPAGRATRPCWRISTIQGTVIGLWALPLLTRHRLTALKEVPAGLKMRFAYGAVAEIFISGRTVPSRRLSRNEITLRPGLYIIGPHAEDYLKDPGMYGKGNPEKI
jgi:hypothetical protein